MNRQLECQIEGSQSTQWNGSVKERRIKRVIMEKIEPLLSLRVRCHIIKMGMSALQRYKR